MLEVVERRQYNNRKVMEFGVKPSVKMKNKRSEMLNLRMKWFVME
jgi:hypothetical protein